MKRIWNTLVPLALTLGLTACAAAPTAGATSSAGAASSAPAGGERSAHTEALVQTGQAPEQLNPDFLRGALGSYAAGLTTLQGQEFPGSVYRDKEGDAILYDSTAVPNEALGWALADLDGDGAEELVVAALNEDHSFRLELYEEQDGKAVQADTLSLKDEWGELPQIIGDKESPSFADFFTYRPAEGEKVCVGLEISQTAGVFVDGVKLDFFAVSCENGALHLDRHASTSGSDGVYSYGYMSDLADVGFFPTWEALFSRSGYVRDGAAEYQDFARVTTSYSVDYEDANAWLSSDGSEPLPCSTIRINSQEELEQNTRDVQSRYQAPVAHALERQRYEAALVRFYFDRQWPDGTPLEDEPDYQMFNDNQYAVQDVDGDGVPELILQYSQTYTAAQLENIYHYDAATGTMRTEASLYPNCTYYNNGVVKEGAAHNHTPSDFWPFTLWRFNAQSGIYELQGSVYAQDKDNDLFDTPFPADVDKDGDGRVFYLNEDAACDNADFEAWEKSVLQDGEELVMDWRALDYVNFDDVMSDAVG